MSENRTEEWKPDPMLYTPEELAGWERFRAAEERTAALDECLDLARKIRDACSGTYLIPDLNRLIDKLAELKWGKES